MSISPIASQALFNAGSATPKELQLIQQMPPEKQAEALLQLQLQKEKEVAELISKMIKHSGDMSSAIIQNIGR